MDRRTFLALAGGFATFGRAQTGQPQGLTTSCAGGWCQPCADGGATFAFHTSEKFPPSCTQACDFEGPKTAVPRRRWSEIGPDDPIWQKTLKAYQLLWNGRPDVLGKCGLPHQAWWHKSYCSGNPINVHENWFFLPWHRAFVYFHERILGKLLGDCDFRLPYWDWEGENFGIPPFYLQLGTPDFITGSCPRDPSPGNVRITQCMLQAWLWSRRFEDFCGAASDTPAGQALGGPHMIVHQNFVGGAMSSFASAAADPIFYAHHANIDRYWSYWMRQYPKYEKPLAPSDASSWLNEYLYFYDEQSRLVRVKPSQLLDDRQLGYYYDESHSQMPDLNLDSDSLADVKQDPTKLYQALLSVLAGSLSDESPVNAFSDKTLKALPNELSVNSFLGVVSSAPPERILSWWTKEVTSVPVQMRVSVPGTLIDPGKYYLIRLNRGNDSALIGGFGTFAGSHMHHAQDKIEFPVAACFNSEVMRLLVFGHGSLSLEWGESYAKGLRNMAISPDTKHTLSFDDLSGLRMLYPSAYKQGVNAFNALPDSSKPQLRL